MSLVQTRGWDLKPGEERDALVLFDNEFYELSIHATGTLNRAPRATSAA